MVVSVLTGGKQRNPMTSNKTELTMVRDFMLAYGQTVRSRPVDTISQHEKMLRLGLIIEEVWELAEAFGIDLGRRPDMVCHNTNIDPVKTLDALSDILYVVFGAYHTCGLGKCAKPAFTEVHESNMSKLNTDGQPVKHPETGKVLKGPNYFQPDLHTIIQAAQRSQPEIFTDADDIQ